jgi:hypothetical protein
MGRFFSWIVRIIIGLLMAAGASVILSPAFAAFQAKGAIPLLVTFVILALLILTAPTIRRSFGRGFVALALAFFALPLSSFLLTGAVTMEAAQTSGNDAGAEAATFLVGGTMTGVATLVSGFFGLILGGICLIIGLILALGGRREVIVVERKSE